MCATRLGIADKLYGAVALRFAGPLHRRLGIAANDPAAVLFTSGSEGAPKGVVLSHANLLANRRQIAARVDFSPADLALNALPMFHSFGLTGGFLLPLLSGVRVFLYPSPLHYRIVPEIAYATGATILFGTDTFLAGYARRANPYDFYALRYVFAGAEPVREETRKAWAERFGKRILEGYGVTECSPVIAVNTPMHYRAGTVGRFLPLVEHRLDPVAGIAKAAGSFVRGPECHGRLSARRRDRSAARRLVRHRRHRHDRRRRLHAILGRAKRFAKIGGEMVSLAAVERIAETAAPEARHAVIALPDPRRGEKLVLVTEAKGLDRNRLIEAAAGSGCRRWPCRASDRGRAFAASRHRQNRLCRRNPAGRAADGGRGRGSAGGTGVVARSRLTERAAMYLLWVIIIGFLAGAIAKFFVGGPRGFIVTTLLGIVGAILPPGSGSISAGTSPAKAPALSAPSSAPSYPGDLSSDRRRPTRLSDQLSASRRPLRSGCSPMAAINRSGVYLLILLLIELPVAFPDGARAAEVNPLRPVDTSSPRATLQDFVETIDGLYRGLKDILQEYAASQRLYLTSDERRRQVESLSACSKGD